MVEGDKRSLLERVGFVRPSRRTDAHFRPDSQKGIEDRLSSGFWNLIRKGIIKLVDPKKN